MGRRRGNVATVNLTEKKTGEKLRNQSLNYRAICRVYRVRICPRRDCPNDAKRPSWPSVAGLEIVMPNRMRPFPEDGILIFEN